MNKKPTLDDIAAAAASQNINYDLKHTLISPQEYYELYPVPGLTYDQWFEGMASFASLDEVIK